MQNDKELQKDSKGSRLLDILVEGQRKTIDDILLVAEARKKGILKGPINYGFEPGFANLIIDTLSDLVIVYKSEFNRILKVASFPLKEQMLEASFHEITNLAVNKVLPDVAANENVFFQCQNLWVIKYESKTAVIQDRKGIQYIAHLLKHPGNSFNALELESIVEKYENRPSGSAPQRVSDWDAIDEYRQWKKRLEIEIKEAEDRGDLGRKEKTQEELEQINEILLTKASKPFKQELERARINITNHIKRTYDDFDKAFQNHTLTAYLKRYIKQGSNFLYNPDLKLSISWYVFTN